MMQRPLPISMFTKVKPKLILLTTLIFVLIIAIIETFIYRVEIPRELDHAIAYDKQEVKGISDRVEETASTYNLLTSSLTSDREFQNILKTDYKSGLEELPLTFELEKILASKNIVSSGKFLNIFIYDKWKLRYRMNLSSDYDPRFLKLNKYIYNPEGSIVWQADRDMIYIHQTIRDNTNLNIIGYITLMVENKFWESRVQSASRRYTYVYNENELPIVQTGPDFAHATQSPLILSISKRIHSGEPTVVPIGNTGDMLLTTYKSPATQWRVSSIVPLEEFTKGTRLIARRIVEIGLAVILTGCLCLWFVSSWLFRPLKELTEAMDRLEADNFNLRVDVKRRDEFGLVGRSFNRMMDKITYLISEVYDKEISRKEAEYRALKAQINPHFLFNTLETIRLLISFGENDKAETATVSLARLLKSSISDMHKEYNTVREELGMIEAYLTIQKMRFHKIEISVNVDESLMELELPQFILQPIVENAYQHGLEHIIGPGQLFINGFSTDNGIKFQIIDNGAGMDESTLSGLFIENRPAKANRSGTGTGVLNVHKRIRLLYGEPYGLTALSSPSAGTMMEILLPGGLHHDI
jgi:two-component system sensor histidine kinase YesM